MKVRLSCASRRTSEGPEQVQKAHTYNNNAAPLENGRVLRIPQ